MSTQTKARKYFDISELTDANGIHKFVCKTCSAKISGSKLYNLSSHLQHIHPELFDEISGSKKTAIQLKRLEMLHSLVEIITVNGRPFRSLLDSGFQSLIKEDLKRFNEAGCSLQLKNKNLPEVKKKMQEMASKVRDKIKNEVQGRVLSLMCDIVSKNRRSIFGISIQYIFNGKLRVRSIGMIELHESNTGLNLAAVVCARLKLYDIDLKQILTMSTDNGSNILKMVRDIDNILQNAIQNEDLQKQNQPPINHQVDADSTEFEIDIETDDQIAQLLLELEETSDDQALDFLFEDLNSERHKKVLRDMTEQIVDEAGPILMDITGVNCAAHTLQLAIKDALNELLLMHKNVINLCRNVAKALRLKSIQHKLDSMGKQFKKPRLENDTRWGSLYSMVRCVILMNCGIFMNEIDLMYFSFTT